jgi:[ribosomal protein S5]-alanine N-acetyltransferase
MCHLQFIFAPATMLQLQSERLLLRNLTETDLDDFLAYRSDPEVARYQGFEPYDRQQAADFIASQKNKAFGIPGEWLQLGIIEKESNRLIGDCAVKLQEHEPRIAELGCTISPSFQKKGYAREILLRLMRFLFEENEIHRIVETTDAENISSIKLLESIGFRREGYFVENIWFKGNWGSEYQYAMLKTEWDRNIKDKGTRT